MVGQSAGSIVNTASVHAMTGVAGGAAYAAAKHGVIGLTRTAALEVAAAGIRVNAVCPGYIHTPMLVNGLGAQPGDETWKEVESLHPMERIGQATEVADAVVWLLSDYSSFVTGHPLAVDGGFLAR
jgi:NAD(P)-dependent dehydrogenase (short-subunit alcohol dehydrogenase family)